MNTFCFICACVLSSCVLLERLQWSRGDGQLQGWNQVGFVIVVKWWWWKLWMVKITMMPCRWATDFMIKCHTAPDTLVAQVPISSWSSWSTSSSGWWRRCRPRILGSPRRHEYGQVSSCSCIIITTLYENGDQDQQPNSWPCWSGRLSPLAPATLAQIWQGGSPFKTVFFSFWYLYGDDW